MTKESLSFYMHVVPPIQFHYTSQSVERRPKMFHYLFATNFKNKINKNGDYCAFFCQHLFITTDVFD